jgi:hypothetical protein
MSFLVAKAHSDYSCRALRALLARSIEAGVATRDMPVVEYTTNGTESLLVHFDPEHPERGILAAAPFATVEHGEHLRQCAQRMLGTSDYFLVRHGEPNPGCYRWYRVTPDLFPFRAKDETWQEIYKKSHNA